MDGSSSVSLRVLLSADHVRLRLPLNPEFDLMSASHFELERLNPTNHQNITLSLSLSHSQSPLLFVDFFLHFHTHKNTYFTSAGPSSIDFDKETKRKQAVVACSTQQWAASSPKQHTFLPQTKTLLSQIQVFIFCFSYSFHFLSGFQSFNILLS